MGAKIGDTVGPMAALGTVRVGLLAALAALPRVASADASAACFTSYEQTQSLRKSGKLREATAGAPVRTRRVPRGAVEGLRAVVRRDRREHPSVVFEARGGDGGESSR